MVAPATKLARHLHIPSVHDSLQPGRYSLFASARGKSINKRVGDLPGIPSLYTPKVALFCGFYNLRCNIGGFFKSYGPNKDIKPSNTSTRTAFLVRGER